MPLWTENSYWYLSHSHDLKLFVVAPTHRSIITLFTTHSRVKWPGSVKPSLLITENPPTTCIYCKTLRVFKKDLGLKRLNSKQPETWSHIWGIGKYFVSRFVHVQFFKIYPFCPFRLTPNSFTPKTCSCHDKWFNPVLLYQSLSTVQRTVPCGTKEEVRLDSRG